MQIQRYVGKILGPPIDSIDNQIDVPSIGDGTSDALSAHDASGILTHRDLGIRSKPRT